MARKKEYDGMTTDASSTTSSSGKRISKSNMPNDAQCKMDINRLNSISKRKEISSSSVISPSISRVVVLMYLVVLIVMILTSVANYQAAYPETSVRSVYDVADLRAQLGSFGLTVRDIPGDGNCLFRALGDQLDGHTGNHLKHRLDTVRYMINHRSHFEPFIDVPFDRYVNDLSRPGTYAGQDALVAFARLHEVNIIIHQLNRPLWKIQGSEDSNAPEVHLSYHNGEHYSSVRRFGDIANTPAGIRILVPTTVPCCASHSIYTSTKPITSKASSGNMQQSVSKLRKNNADASSEGTIHRYLYGEDDFTTLVHEVMNRTGCRDATLAAEALIENSRDLDQTVDYLLSVALFVAPGGDGNLSKSKNQSDMEMTSESLSFFI
ncbi:unnamed protein product [Onchocerca flexuosa]|uniref:OTU domain-containing protein n=1 Tax=Onchocerca flexuosa TaxID=387005 RepID=A0A183H737_9BILA|nr:unnamed protein product [Onchocerca flexuosa]